MTVCTIVFAMYRDHKGVRINDVNGTIIAMMSHAMVYHVERTRGMGLFALVSQLEFVCAFFNQK